MNLDESNTVERFINGLESLMIGIQQVDSSCMEAFGSISKRDFGLCAKLGKEKSMIMREVAEFLQVPMSTATGIIDKLIERGLVKREYSPEDRRIVIVGLSDEGAAIYQMLNSKLFQYGKMLLQEFDAEEKEVFVSLMERAALSTSQLERVP